MKKMIFLAFTFVTFNSFANCTNFAGQYKLNAPVEIGLQIDQNQCESIELTYKREDSSTLVEKYLLNGEKVKYAEYPEVGLIIYVTPHFKNNDIIIEIENFWSDAGKVEKTSRRIHLDGNVLLDQIGKIRNDGVFTPTRQSVYLKN